MHGQCLDEPFSQANVTRRVRFFSWLIFGLDVGRLPTDCLQATQNKTKDPATY
jgi:hypothetical protein